jgi:Ni/Co efflux regulator RcnB
MRAPVIAYALFSIAMASANLSALADDHDNHQYVHHDEWRKGAKIQNEDWNRGEHVDYRERHLRAPPSGYEWRLVDGNYVLAAVATGVIASVIVATATGH